ncbi:MAG TPA: C40 family peptidase [Blastocatellia bacterium]|nr:C40 family peptidase [Blastocatellia bacterium]
MKLLIRQIYITALICSILYGISKSNYRGADLLTGAASLAELVKPSESQPAAEPQDPTFADAAESGAVETAPVAETAPAVETAPALDSHQPAHPERSVISEQDGVERLLHAAITVRMGRPYRSGGTDDNGYDCSGFVWRVFHEAGADLKRSSARDYWETLPEATKEERTQFGTLVFFKDVSHVGVVRDSYSFYHASSSNGITRSNYSDYWGGQVIGYRRVPMPQYLSMNR